jgi:DNA-binding LytR/AlgR family response regulator
MKPGTASNLYILAVEDDPIYAASLELTLHDLGYTEFSIVDNAASALKIFKEQSPDILLADIDINGPINGIELVDIISAMRKIPVVYVTAFTDAQTFQKAKQTKPSAYIVKPYHATNLQAAMELALQQTEAESKPGKTEKPEDLYHIAEALFVKYNNKLFKIRTADILFIEVDEKYCYITTASKRYAVNMRLKNLVDDLPETDFLQIHRSYAVRLDAIDEVNLDDNLVKINGREFPIGKTYKDVFFAKLKLL